MSDNEREQARKAAFQAWRARYSMNYNVPLPRDAWNAGADWQREQDVAERDALAAQVGALRGVLEVCHPEMNPEEPCVAYEALTDTTEAAARYQREQRLAGARAFVRRYESIVRRYESIVRRYESTLCHTIAPESVLKHVLAEMERES